MAATDRALDLLKDALAQHPEVASAALVALAVERGVLSQRQAETLVRGFDLADVEGMAAELTARVDEAGRRDELVELMVRGRRVLERAQRLLRLRGS